MIKDYKLISAYVNLDMGIGEGKICCVDLDIKDEEHVQKAKDICNDNGDYYKNGWVVECVVDEDATTVDRYELFYIGNDGRELIMNLLGEDDNEKLIADINEFLLNELDYVYCKKRKEGIEKANVEGRILTEVEKELNLKENDFRNTEVICKNCGFKHELKWEESVEEVKCFVCKEKAFKEVISIVEMLTQIIDVDFQCMNENGFSCVSDILYFYRNKSEEYIRKVYFEYYGNGAE